METRLHMVSVAKPQMLAHIGVRVRYAPGRREIFLGHCVKLVTKACTTKPCVKLVTWSVGIAATTP